MSATKTRKVQALLRDRYGIEDKQLAYEIVQVVMTPDDDAPRPRVQNHPAVIVARRVMGCEIPPAMFQEIIKALGETPDEKRANDCYYAQVRRGNSKAFYWLDDYAGVSRKPSPTPAAPAAVFEWRE